MTPEEIRKNWQVMQSYLVTPSDICEALGVTQSALEDWKSNHEGFPTPISFGNNDSDRQLYIRAEVIDWVINRPTPDLSNNAEALARVEVMRAELRRAQEAR